MAGMKPRILCVHCSALLQPGNQFCSSCGAAVDWTEEIASGSPMNLRMEATKLELREKKLRPKEISTSWSLKSILGVVVIAALAVIVYEFFIEKSPSAGSPQQVPAQQMTLRREIAQKQAEIQVLGKDIASHLNDMVLTLQLANFLHVGFSYERAISIK